MLERDRYLLFSAFGLVSPLRLEPLLNALETLPALVHPAVIQVRSPYVANLRARLDALEPVRARFATFVDMMNSFYRNKKVNLQHRAASQSRLEMAKSCPTEAVFRGECSCCIS